MPSIAPSKSTTSTRVARIPYLNSAPYFRGLALAPRVELTDCVPRELGERAARGEVAAGLLPLVDYLRLSETFERIGHFGIAVRGRSGSVMLFSRKPIRQLDGAVIAVTEETSTSAVLLRLILEQRYRLTPASYVRVDWSAARPGPVEGEAGDALLLIGDEALRARATNRQYPFEIDLAFEWWLWQHLPFVFAVWAIRKDAGPDEHKELERALARALALNQGQQEAIAREASASLGLTAEELSKYLGSFIYRLSRPEEEAITQFAVMVNAHHLL